MDINELKSLLKKIDEETEQAHNNYADRSSVHSAALKIMEFEKELHYGDASNYQHLSKVRDIIESHLAGILDEVS